MIINRHDCISYLLKLDTDECEPLLKRILDDTEIIIDKDILNFLIKHNIELPVVDFYNLLNNKAHPIIKQLLDNNVKEVFHYIKLATSIITQATITLEHQFKDDIVGANEFIKNIGLPDLSKALAVYFETGNYDPLLKNLEKNKEDIKLILN